MSLRNATGVLASYEGKHIIAYREGQGITFKYPTDYRSAKREQPPYETSMNLLFNIMNKIMWDSNIMHKARFAFYLNEKGASATFQVGNQTVTKVTRGKMEEAIMLLLAEVIKREGLR